MMVGRSINTNKKRFEVEVLKVKLLKVDFCSTDFRNDIIVGFFDFMIPFLLQGPKFMATILCAALNCNLYS